MIRALALPLALSTAPAFADTQAIAPGAQLSPAQVGHIFDAVCFGSTPIGMTERVVLAESAFFFAPEDLGTDFGYVSPDGAIIVTLDGNPIEAVCTLSVASNFIGDGAALYDSVLLHLATQLDAPVPEGTAIDGGLQWQWDQLNASFTMTFIETEGAFLLSLTAES